MKPLVASSLFALAATLTAASVAAATQERIFSNGFDPCCRVGGTVSGLTGSGLVLHLVGTGAVSENLAIDQDGLFDFATTIPTGDVYGVTIHGQPASQTCVVTHAAGTMGEIDIDDVTVTCGGNLQWDSGTWGQDWN
jgi:hypothetical protein